ncbi:transglycosylase SLT domain-containing protein [Cerasicoccus maritimus]|uniref:transglycosylase SLT domain-containing protein n=1 Tax=Cerasicoccus maritimus TaxID=490089 RepID=UPI002852BFD5|nr:transglycosylase SLT domain-containing protein [Cerasicoccus maritimus]
MPNLRQLQQPEYMLSIAAVVIFAVFFSLARPGFSQIKSPEGKYQIWVDIEQAAKAGDLDPNFVYAICVAESTLDPRANSGYAKGLMQLSKVAWKEVSKRPYSQAYNPKANLEVGVAYLNHLKDFLNENNAFSYSNLAASYRYGPYALKDADFRPSRLDKPHNLIYQQLFAGVTDPVEIPQAPAQ